jgi:hypothetical protein
MSSAQSSNSLVISAVQKVALSAHTPEVVEIYWANTLAKDGITERSSSWGKM